MVRAVRFSDVGIAAWGERLAEGIARGMQLDEQTLEVALCTLLAGGHLLLEDRPGVGKTQLARSLADSIGGTFARVQGTVDLLPSDVLGTTIWRASTESFEFHRGPVFANVVLVDELNRATPKTQSGLLEAMAEGQVTVDGTAHPLPQPFTVIATQNPTAGYDGTYALPPAQLDRFMTRLSLGYPSAGAEVDLLDSPPAASLSAIADLAEAEEAIAAVAAIEARRPLLEYVVGLVDATRRHPQALAGASPRGGLMLLAAARAHAALQGRDFVVPDDVQALAVPVLAHRIQTVEGSPPGRGGDDRRRRPGRSHGAMTRGVAAEVLGFVLLLTAIVTGSVALFAFALGLLVVVGGCLATLAIAARRVKVERRIDRPEVVEGRPLTLRFDLRELGWLPIHAEVRDEAGRWRRLDDTASRGCTIERPGPHLVGGSEVRLRDDLCLFARHLSAGNPTVVLVLPDPAKAGVRPPPGGAERGRTQPDGLRPSGADPGRDLEPDGLQQYARGTPIGRIHWPSVARGGEWQERRVITSPRGVPLVVVDLSDAASEEAIDWALRTAAGHIQALAGSGGCRVLLPGEASPIAVASAADGWPDVHRRLAYLRGHTAALSAPPGAIFVRASRAPAPASPPPPLPTGVVPVEWSPSGHGEGGLPA